jgi:hypothetical protein
LKLLFFEQNKPHINPIQWNGPSTMCSCEASWETLLWARWI